MTTHASVTPYDLATPDARTALTLYQYLFFESLGKYANPGLAALGMQETSSALLEKYPITVGDPIFEKIVGDGAEYKENGELFISFTTDIYGAGVKEKASRLRTAEWARRGWGLQPAKHAAALPLFFERLIATALMAGESSASPENIDGTTTIKFFQEDHPCDPFGRNDATFDNLFTGSVNGAYPGALPFGAPSVATVRKLLRTQLGQNGTDYRQTELTHVLVGPDLEEAALTLFKEDRILVTSGSSTAEVERANPNKKYKPVTVLVNNYLTESGVWYPMSADILGMLPWMTLTKVPNNSGAAAGMPAPGPVGPDGLEWVIDDENSETYKHGSKVGPKGTVAIAAQLEAGAALTIPWAIFRCKAS